MTFTEYDTQLPPLDITLESSAEAPPPLRERLTNSLTRWLQLHWIDLIIVLILMDVGGAVHAAGMYISPARFDDEGTYTAYAWAVTNLHALGHYTYWYAHPPLGWMQISLWTTLTDGFDRAPYAIAAAREFMLVCKLVAIPLLYGLGRRLGYGRPGCVASVAIFALSPLAVYFTRAALLDNIVTPWLIASFFFAASRRRSVGAASASAVCFAVAVLSKETALLYLPAVVMLLWQRTDRRNRRFTVGLFTAWLVVICAAFPMYAFLKNELLVGPGHVSLEYAVRWQLFDRAGSGSIFDPKSTAHAVIRSWLDQDSWLPKLALATTIPGLILARTRAVAFALSIQVIQLLRGGYLPYPYVIAMIPFAALTIGGVLDWLWTPRRGRLRPDGVSPALTRWCARRLRPIGSAFSGALERLGDRRCRAVRLGWQTTIAGGCACLAFVVASAWRVPLHDLQTVNRDKGKAQALAWVVANVPKSAYVVVDDSLWVDLVRAGYPRKHVIWFTKLDVDKDVKLPTKPQWAGIDYVVLDHEDDLSVHLQVDGTPSHDTIAQFPTLGAALAHASTVRHFGLGLDGMTVRQVRPGSAIRKRGP